MTPSCTDVDHNTRGAPLATEIGAAVGTQKQRKSQCPAGRAKVFTDNATKKKESAQKVTWMRAAAKCGLFAELPDCTQLNSAAHRLALVRNLPFLS